MTPRDHVIAAVEAVFGVPGHMLLSTARERRVSHARWAAFHAVRSTGLGIAEVGRKFGFDHSSVRHGLQALDKAMLLDPALAEKVEAVRKKMGGPIKRQKRPWRPWTARDKAAAIKMFRDDVSLCEIGRILHRSAGGVHRLLKDAGHIKPPPRGAPKGRQIDVHEKAFRDNFAETEAKWAAALAGQRYTSLNIPQKPMVWLEP